MSKYGRIGMGFLLVVSVMIVGLVLGMYIGGHCCVAPGSGLAGGAIVVGYGVLAAAIMGLIALVMAIKLPAPLLTKITFACALAGAILGAILFKVFLDSKQKSALHRQQAYENMLEYRVTMELTSSAPEQNYQRITFDWSKRSYTVKDKQGVCTIGLTGKQGAKMLAALRGVDGITYQNPSLCDNSTGPVLYKLDMLIVEGLPPNSEEKLEITKACLQRYPALNKPFEVAAALHAKNGLPDDC